MSKDTTAPPYEPSSQMGTEKKYALEHVDHVDTAAQYKEDAMESENKEQAMTVLEAVKAYPMACTWAFIMSSTIVRTRG
jgi:SP family general alpha glucoside:H+ symporter-like MFS transporter